MGHALNFDEQHFDKLTVGFIGETSLEEKISREKLSKLVAIHQIRQNFPLSDFCTSYTVVSASVL